MKLLIFGDMHIDKKFWGDQKLYLDEIYKVKRFIKESVEKYKPDYIINLGDIFHSFTQNKLDVIAFMEVYDMYKSLLKTSNIITLTGNHDYFNDRDGKYNMLKAFNIINKKYESKVIDNDRLYSFHYKPLNTLFLFVSYTEDMQMLKDTFDEISETIADGVESYDHIYVFGHFDLAEAYSVIKKEDGDYEGASIKDMSFLPKVDKVYLGHWHKQKMLYKGKVDYIGAVRNLMFDDLGNYDKGAVVLDISNSGVKENKIANPYSSIFYSEKVNNIEDKFDPYNFDSNRNYYLKLIYDKGDKHKDMFLKNLTFMKHINHTVRVYDQALERETLSLLDLDVTRDSSNNIKEFIPLFKQYVKKSKKYPFDSDAIEIAEKLFSTKR